MPRRKLPERDAVLDPTTTPRALRELAQTTRRHKVLEAVASHPRAPTDLLLSLASRTPHQCMGNPRFTRALRRDPAVLRTMTPDTLRDLVRYCAPDARLIRLLFEVSPVSFEDRDEEECECSRRHTTAAQALVCNPATPSDILEQLCGARAQRLWYLGNDNEDEDDDEHVVRRALARHPNATPALLVGLLADPDRWIRMIAMKNPNAPAQLRSLLLRCGVLDDMNEPAALQGSLSGDDVRTLAEAGPFTWDLAARHPAVAPAALAALIASPSLAARAAAIANPSTPARALRGVFAQARRLPFEFPARKASELLGGTPPELRYGRRSRPRDPDALLKLALALQPATPEDLLCALAGEREHSLVQAIVRHPALTPLVRLHLLYAHPAFTPETLADPDAHPDLLHLIAVNHRKGIRYLDLAAARALARHPKTPPAALRLLEDFDDAQVVSVVAERLASEPRVEEPRAEEPRAAPPRSLWARLWARLRGG